jgi:5-methylcytosine-specific restriction enzyme A
MKQRDRRLQRTHYLCEDCQAEGRVTIADEVHHVVALADGGPDTDENTMNLCKPHHQKRTEEQFGFTTKQAFGTDGWPLN